MNVAVSRIQAIVPVLIHQMLVELSGLSKGHVIKSCVIKVSALGVGKLRGSVYVALIIVDEQSYVYRNVLSLLFPTFFLSAEHLLLHSFTPFHSFLSFSAFLLPSSSNVPGPFGHYSKIHRAN